MNGEKPTSSSHAGFTLVELMIVVAIVAILASIAYPAYTSSVLKGKRAQARTALAELMQQQERYMTQRNTYFKFTTDATGKITTDQVGEANTFRNFSGDNRTDPAYWLSATDCTLEGLALTECIQLEAAPTKPDDDVKTLIMTSTGLKRCTGNTTNPKLCWP